MEFPTLHILPEAESRRDHRIQEEKESIRLQEEAQADGTEDAASVDEAAEEKEAAARRSPEKEQRE